MFSKTVTKGIEILTLETEHLKCSIIPALGGKIWRLYNKQLSIEFLWINTVLPVQMQECGVDYDSHFLGAIDELIPNDMMEIMESIDYPDHGELWTIALEYSKTDDKITVKGLLSLSGLHSSKAIHLSPNKQVVHIEYAIKNTTNETRHFLWKLHAALRIEAADQLLTNAKYGQVEDPAYSWFKDTAPFKWLSIEGTDTSIAPPKCRDRLLLYE